jgi:hypothetical protein
MDTNEFRSLSVKLHHATCVEDVFGEKPPTYQELKNWVSEITDFATKVEDGNIKSDAIHLVEQEVAFFSKWARTQIALKTYGKKEECPLILNLDVVEFEGQPKFGLRKGKSTAFLEELHAINFKGYWHRDKVILRKDDKILREGYVQYYGTHAATEFFFEIISQYSRDIRLTASMFEIGTTLEIRTWAFFSVGEFLLKEFR